MDVRNTRFTEDFRVMSCPMCMGCRNVMWSTDAVTTGQRVWRMAASAPDMSTRCITRPPSRKPSGLASFGSAISEYSEADARTGLPVSGAGSGFMADVTEGSPPMRAVGLFVGIALAPQVAFHIGAGLPLERLAGAIPEQAGGRLELDGAVLRAAVGPLGDVEDLDEVSGVVGNAVANGVRALVLPGEVRTSGGGVADVAAFSQGLDAGHLFVHRIG